MTVERRAYTENAAAQETAYWYCREHDIRVDDLDIGQILQVAAPIILAGAVEENERLLNRLKTLYADLAAPGPIDAERQRALAELARDAIRPDATGGEHE
jgi:hypothetical protein